MSMLFWRLYSYVRENGKPLFFLQILNYAISVKKHADLDTGYCVKYE